MKKVYRKDRNWHEPNYKLGDGERNLARMEIRCIIKAVNRSVHIEEAADILGIHERTLRMKIVQYKLIELYDRIPQTINELKKRDIL